MRFHNEIVRFSFAGIPMVGNLGNGYAIGLTAEGGQVCDRLLVEDVSDQEIAQVDEALYQHLCNAGFFDEGVFPQTLRSAYVHVTQRCNLDCVGCYSLDEHRNTLEDASTENFKTALDKLAKGGLSGVIISGGEPFLREDLADLAIYAKQECGIASVSIISNGTCLSVSQLEKMVRYIDQVAISFDGSSADDVAYIRKVQRFDRLVEAVKAIQQIGIRSHIITTIHAKNISAMKRYAELGRELGVTISYSLLSCSACSSELEDLMPKEESLKLLAHELIALNREGASVNDAPVGSNLTVKNICGAGRSTLSVGADGTVYPCHMLHDSSLAMGNIFYDDIESILKSPVADKFRRLSVEDFDDCKDCGYRWVCGGGCRGRSYTAFGNLHSKDAYCDMITEFYDIIGEQLNATYGS